jgi:hypothetical protein
LTITDGTIEFNTAKAHSLADIPATAAGGGLYLKGFAFPFTMEGGSINNNTAKSRVSGSGASKAYGGGAASRVGAVFTMSGGEIRENTAKSIGNESEASGGGVSVIDSSFNKNADANISDNVPEDVYP